MRMKPIYVIIRIGCYATSIECVIDDYDEATTYCENMNKNDMCANYHIIQTTLHITKGKKRGK